MAPDPKIAKNQTILDLRESLVPWNATAWSTVNIQKNWISHTKVSQHTAACIITAAFEISPRSPKPILPLLRGLDGKDNQGVPTKPAPRNLRNCPS